MGVFDGIPGYEEHILDAGKEPLFLLLVSFLITFALTRLYTRLARVYGLGSASAGGVHLHHYVVGIFLMFSAGLAMFALQPGRVATGVLAIFFGGGAAVTLDEFALWFHLKDVYWSEEGRSSIDATVLALLVGGLILVGASPLGTGEDYYSLLGLSAIAAFHFFWVAITLLKGKLLFGVVALFLPVLGLVGGIRLAKPTSPWAKWFYRSGEESPGTSAGCSGTASGSFRGRRSGPRSAGPLASSAASMTSWVARLVSRRRRGKRATPHTAQGSGARIPARP